MRDYCERGPCRLRLPPIFLAGALLVSANSAGSLAAGASVTLPDGRVGIAYSGRLTAAPDLDENGVAAAIDRKSLPPGLSIRFFIPPCAPQATQCPAQPTLAGVPTVAGAYRFVVAVPSGAIEYQLHVLP
jgi:hypothetical protein